jgi:hypothetical protein
MPNPFPDDVHDISGCCSAVCLGVLFWVVVVFGWFLFG